MIHAASAAITHPLLRMGLRLAGGQHMEAPAGPGKRAALHALSIIQSKLDVTQET